MSSCSSSYNEGTSSLSENPVQEFGQLQLKELDEQLCQVKKSRKSLEKKRKSTQKQLIEKEKKQTLCNAKYQNAIQQRDQGRLKLEKLGAAISEVCRAKTNLEGQLNELQEETQSQKEAMRQEIAEWDGRNSNLSQKIQQINNQYDLSLKKNSKWEAKRKELKAKMDCNLRKQLQLKVNLEKLKNRNEFVISTKDNELAEKLRLESELHKLKIKEDKLNQDKVHSKEIIDNQQNRLSDIINQNSILAKTVQQQSLKFDNLKNKLNSVVWELQCVDDDKEHLLDDVKLLEKTTTNEKCQLEQSLKENNCILKYIKDHEQLCVADSVSSSSFCNELCISNPSTSTTYLHDPCESSGASVHHTDETEGASHKTDWESSTDSQNTGMPDSSESVVSQTTTTDELLVSSTRKTSSLCEEDATAFTDLSSQVSVTENTLDN